MNGLDYGLLGLTILIVLGGLLAVLLVILAFKRAREIRAVGYVGKNKNVVLARISFWSIILGAAFGITFLVADDAAEAAAAVGLLSLGVICTFFIRLPRPKSDRSLNEKLVYHSYFAWPWRHKLVMIPGIILILGAGVFVYDRLEVRENRLAFQQARVAIDTIYAEIVKKVGMPDSYRRTNECSRPSQEFEKGDLSCSIGSDFIYGVNNQASAGSLTVVIQRIISNNPVLTPTTHESDILATPAPSNYSDSTLDYYKINREMICTFRYLYNHPSETYLKIKRPENEKPFYVTLSCSGGAKQQYY